MLKPDSKSIPVGSVLNSSANYMGHTLSEYWAKGPDYSTVCSEYLCDFVKIK